MEFISGDKRYTLFNLILFAETSRLKDSNATAKFLSPQPPFYATSSLSRIPVSRVPNSVDMKLCGCEAHPEDTTEWLWRLKALGGKASRKVFPAHLIHSHKQQICVHLAQILLIHLLSAYECCREGFGGKMQEKT